MSGDGKWGTIGSRSMCYILKTHLHRYLRHWHKLPPPPLHTASTSQVGVDTHSGCPQRHLGCTLVYIAVDICILSSIVPSQPRLTPFTCKLPLNASLV